MVLLVGFGLLLLGLVAVAVVTFMRSAAQVEPALTASPVPGAVSPATPDELPAAGGVVPVTPRATGVLPASPE